MLQPASIIVRRLAALTLVLGACGGGEGKTTGESTGDIAKAWSPSSIREVKGVDANLVREEISKLVGGKKPGWVTEHQWEHAQKAYKLNSRGPLWLQEDGIGKRVKSLTNVLTSAHADGLRLDEYPIAELVKATNYVNGTKKPEAQQLATADVLYTVAFVALAEDLLAGQVDPRSVSQAWNIDPQEEGIDSAIVRVIRSEKLEEPLASLRPADKQYAFLRDQLAKYRELAAAGGWQPIPAGKPLKRGDRDSRARIAALEARLRAEGLLESSGSDSAGARAVYDQRHAAAVAQFQAMHAIGVDSMLGAETLEALNKPASFRLGQIAANLERLRWMPRSTGSRYIMVNVPAFRLEGYENGEKAIEMKVIVGAEYEERATPVFSDTMAYVVFRPYWNVTDDIANNEIWPLIRSNPGYMQANNYETFQEGGQTRIRQRPGPENSLGLVKFIFPNSFNIYLHDTPAKTLFDKDVRAFSHGCIRVEKPEELAQWVLGWSADRVHQAMQSGSNDNRVNLPKRLPVYIGYFTTYERDGRLYFGNDLYDRDDKLVSAMQAGGSSTDAVRAAQELRKLVGV
jgi:L,D-transpeptidase YcbB